MMTGYGKQFYKRFCENCIYDINKDTEPTCKILEQILAGGCPPARCEKYKRSGKNNE